MSTAASTVVVRRAGPDDAATVLEMVREIAAHEGDAADVVGDEATWTAMLARPDVVVLVAERDGVPAGYVSAVRRLHLWFGSDILSLDDLFVREGFRDAGVGRLLMRELGARCPRAHGGPVGGAPGQRRRPALLPPIGRHAAHEGGRPLAPLRSRSGPAG